MRDTISPLQSISQKELDLRRRVEEADRQAEAQIQAAREEAKKTIDQADREGQAEAEAIFRQGVEEARQQAEAIVTAAHTDAATLRAQATPRLAEAAERIVVLVLSGERPVGD